jgi:hypothetical protein
MKTLNLGSIQIPISAATKTFAILAKRGAGKTYSAAVEAEEFHKNGIPFVVFDPIDVWWGLRFKADGKTPGLPVVVFGLQHADIELTRSMGREIAQAVVRDNVSCVISTFGMPKTHQRHLIAEFAEEILNINNTPRHIFVEEAHEFVPQRVTGDIGKTFNAVSNLVVMGRNRGIGVTLINQRAATINKDVLTQIDTLLAFRNTGPQDRKALKEWVESHSAEDDTDFNDFMKALPSLPTGEGYIWSPEFMGVFEKVKIRARETFHPDREKLGENFVMPTLHQGDVEDFIKKFKTTAVVDPENPIGIKKNKPVKVVMRVPDEDVLKMVKEEVETQYKNRLDEKDEEIASLTRDLKKVRDTIEKVKKLIAPFDGDIDVTHNNEAVDMWIEKLGSTQAARILKFLSEKSGLKFTRSQIALANHISPKSSTFYANMATLRRNDLILEQNGQIEVNPNLFI